MSDSRDSVKKCDFCLTWLPLKEFHNNKNKADGKQNKCKDCIRDYHIAKKNAPIINEAPREFYYIPDIYLVGYGRMQTYQHCCLNCEKPFFEFIKMKDKKHLYCDFCHDKEIPLPQRNQANVNYVGNVIGWLMKIEQPSKKRSHRNYKQVYQRDKFTCQYCGYNMENATQFMALHIDHIKPWSAQGGNAMQNLCVSCQECNNIASDKWFSTFEDKKEYILFNKKRQTC